MRKDAEPASSDSGDLDRAFLEAVASVARGELTFPAPFDLATSAALSSNLDSGSLAERLFEVTALRDCRYEVSITALAPEGSEPLRREILNTTAASTGVLVALLDGLLEEFEARLDAQQSAD